MKESLMMISGKTMIYGIFGHPVEHTFSPGMHNSAFKKLGMDACYVLLPSLLGIWNLPYGRWSPSVSVD
jgi:hypothetical protein